MKKGPANQTALDIPPAFRNDVLRNKQVLVGCGGGFHHQPSSSPPRWGLHRLWPLWGPYTPAQAATRQCVDLQGKEYHCSGYRLVHWDPSLRSSTRMLNSSRSIALQIAATISYYVARNVRLDSESSKLLILSPHSDTISDLEDVLGASATDLPPTLYDFYLVALYRLHYLSSRLHEFPKRNHNNQLVDPKPDSITNLAIHAHIKDDLALIPELEARATLPVTIELVKAFPRFFTSYCTLSNTVKAIGIGGTASLFLSIKMSNFLADSKEAEARNLVALTRSKGLCVVLLPFTDRYPSSALHSLPTMCGYRQGIFTVGAAQLDHQALGDFLSQPDTVLDDVPSTFDATSWKVTHQLTFFGHWRLLPLVMGLTYGSTTYFFHLTVRDQIPSANEWQLEAENFEWHGALPGHPLIILSFALNSIALSAQRVHIARFPYPAPNSRSKVDSIEPRLDHVLRSWHLLFRCRLYESGARPPSEILRDWPWRLSSSSPHCPLASHFSWTSLRPPSCYRSWTVSCPQVALSHRSPALWARCSLPSFLRVPLRRSLAKGILFPYRLLRSSGILGSALPLPSSPGTTTPPLNT